MRLASVPPRGSLDTLRFAASLILALAVMVSTGPVFSFAAPPLPGLAWKRLVPADLAFVLLVAVSLAAVLVHGRAALPRVAVWRAPAVLLAGLLVAVAFSPSPVSGLPDLARFGYSVVVYVLISQVTFTKARVRRFSLWYLAAAAAVCAVTLGGYLADAIFGWRTWLVQASTAPGWQANIALRTMGPFAHPTTLAVFINSAAFFACVLLVLPGRRRRTTVLIGIALGVLGATLLLTSSRAVGGVLLAFALWSLLSAHRSPWQVVRTLVLGEAVVGFTVVCALTLTWNFFPFSYARNADTGFASVRFYAVPEERALIYTAAFHMFLERPLTGVGPGLFGENLKRFVTFPQFQAAARFFNDAPEDIVKRYQTGPDPHSSWFGWLARGGVVGLGAIAWFFLSRSVAYFRAARAPGTRGRIALLAVVFLMGFLYDGFAVEILHLRFLWIFLAFATAVLDAEFP